MNVLAVVAHPDDEVIGCGAALAKLAAAGHEVRILLPLRRGDPRGVARWGDLIAAFGQACALLGAAPVIAEPLIEERALDAQFHQLHDLVLPWIEWADTVFTHWPGDTNQVHRGLSRVVEVATRPFRRRKDVFLFEVATSTEQGFLPDFRPNSYCCVEEAQAAQKCAAMALYASEFEPGRSPDSLRRRMQVRGEEVGAPFAEAFYLAHHSF